MITNITTIQDYFDLLITEDAFTYNGQLTPALIKLRDGENDEEKLAAIALELFVNDQTAVDGKITGRMKYADGSSFPGTDLIEPHLYRLRLRLQATSNPKYLAKYNHILWDSKAKHIQYARAAVDNYLLMLQSGPFPLTGNGPNHLFEATFKNAFSLAQMINYRRDEIITLLVGELTNENINGYKKMSLMRYVTELGKKIDQIVLQHFFDYANEVINNGLYQEFKDEFLGYLIGLAQRLSLPQKPYFIHMAEHCLAKASADKEPFVKFDYLKSAMGYYQKASEPAKAEETAVLLEETKKQLNFRKQDFSFEDDRLQQWWDGIRHMTDVLVAQCSSQMLFEHFILDDALLPNADILDKPIIPSTFAFINVSVFDINRNVDKEKSGGVDQYDLQIKNFTIRHLWLLFSKGIKSGKIGYEQLMQYFRGHTWYGQNFVYGTADGLNRGFDWIELLAPGFQIFFEQSQIDLETQTNHHSGYILAVDSLVLKFEGLLREFSKALGAQTIEHKESATTERISFEKLLDNEKIKALIPANDIAFFKYIFTSSGMNLRNNIAHCFYDASHYSAVLMMLLTVAFLRLGNYKLQVVTVEPPADNPANP
jgi:hypothetical protein